MASEQYEQFELQPRLNSDKNVYSVDIRGVYTRTMWPGFLTAINNIKFRLVGEEGVLEESAPSFIPLALSGLTKEEKTTLLTYFEEKVQGAPVGTRWCFLRDPTSQVVYAYGANLKRKDMDDSQVAHERELLMALLRDSPPDDKQTTLPYKKIVAYAALGLLLLYSGLVSFALYKKIYPEGDNGESIPGVDPMSTLRGDPPPPIESSAISRQPLWDFYSKTFPDVYAWLTKHDATAKQRELAGRLIKYSHIESIWKHTRQSAWQQISINTDTNQLGKVSEYDRIRLILFDFFNNNREVYDIWADEENRNALRNTNFARLLNIYSTYAYKYRVPEGTPLANKVFYWQTGDLGLTLPEIDINKVLLDYQITATDWEKDITPNREYIKGTFNFPTRLIRVTDTSGPDDKWFIAVYKTYADTLPKNKWISKITLFKYGEVSAAYDSDLGLLTKNKPISTSGETQIIEWYSISPQIAEKYGFKDLSRKTYTQNNPIEFDVVSAKTAQYIRRGDFQPVSFSAIRAEEPKELILQDPDTGSRYGLKTANPITAYVLLNVFRTETLERLEIPDVERRENSILESHIMLSRYIPLSGSPSYSTFPMGFLKQFAGLPSFVASKNGEQFEFYNQAKVKFVEPYMFEVDANEIKLNSCIPGAKVSVNFGAFYMIDKGRGQGCQLSDKPL